MRILLMTPHPPHPTRGGAAIRNWHLIRIARDAGHTVHLATFGNPASTTPAAHCITVPAPAARNRITQIRDLPHILPDLARRLRSPAMQDAIAAAHAAYRYDLVQVEGLEMWANLPDQWNGETPALIYDAHNAEATLQHRMAQHAFAQRDALGAGYSVMQYQKLRRYERDVVRRATATLAVSAQDAAALESLAGRPVDVVPIGVDTAYFSPDAPDIAAPIAFDVVFSGTLDYRPNADAALWLARDIWEHVRTALPDATLAIVGANPLPALRALDGRDGITITGAVPDDRPYMAGAGVYALPIRFGAGVRLKLLNAMSNGCAVVTTPAAREGVTALHGTHFVVASDHAPTFAAALIRLLRDGEQRATLGAAARVLMQTQYDWSVVAPSLRAVYRQLEPYRAR